MNHNHTYTNNEIAITANQPINIRQQWEIVNIHYIPVTDPWLLYNIATEIIQSFPELLDQ